MTRTYREGRRKEYKRKINRKKRRKKEKCNEEQTIVRKGKEISFQEIKKNKKSPNERK